MNPWTKAASVALLRAEEAVRQWQAREPHNPQAAAHLKTLEIMRQRWEGQEVLERVRAHVPAPRPWAEWIAEAMGGTGG